METRILAARPGIHPVDHHTLLGPAQALYRPGSPDFFALYTPLRDLVFDAIRAMPNGHSFILTEVLSDEPEDAARVESVRKLANDKCIRFIPVPLDIDETENLRRATTPDRMIKQKLRDDDTLRTLRAKHRLYAPDGCPLIRLDVTNLSAEEAAAHIAAML